MAQALEKVAAGELERTCELLEAKNALFSERLASPAPAGLGSVLDRIFSIRGAGRKTVDRLDPSALCGWIEELLRGDDPIEERFAAFCDRPELAELGLTKRRDLASELLRYHDPTSCWLWTRWLWDPRTSTGALPLVTSVFHDLGGSSDAEVYQKVGYALKLVQQTAEAAGFDRLTHSVFGTDVFLSCVYVIYAYTVLKMRMTQEFNKVMPGLSEFSRRLLGVHQR